MATGGDDRVTTINSINGDGEEGERRALLLPGDSPPPSVSNLDNNTGAVDYGTVYKQQQRQVYSFQDIRMNIAAGMMDLSLFIANTNQLANVLRTPGHVQLTTLEVVTAVLICLSIFLQVFVVLLLIWSRADRAGTVTSNRGTVTCVFLILAINVFVACLNNEQQHYCGVDAPQPSTSLQAGVSRGLDCKGTTCGAAPVGGVDA